MRFPSKEKVESLRRQYPVGARVELLQMNDEQAPPAGTLGTVYGVDDTGSILVHWDNGSSLNVVYGKDYCSRLMPGEEPGSSLTLIEKDGKMVPIGPIPKIDMSKMPDYAVRSLARTVYNCVKGFYSDPENVKKMEEWKKRRAERNDEGKKPE